MDMYKIVSDEEFENNMKHISYYMIQINQKGRYKSTYYKKQGGKDGIITVRDESKGNSKNDKKADFNTLPMDREQ